MRRTAWIWRGLAAGALSLLVACGGGDKPGEGPTAVFALPDAEAEGEAAPGFFDLPWPTDLRRTEDGHVDVGDFPRSSSVALLRTYLRAISSEVDGYSTSVTSYLRFSEPVDPASLPQTPEESLGPEASVFIVGVDPDSDGFGERHPAVVRYQQEPTLYWPENTVAVRPVYGVPLAPETTYAIVATGAVTTPDGEPFGRDVDFHDVMKGRAPDGALEVYGPATAGLEMAGVQLKDVISLAVFTTQNPTRELVAMRDWIVDDYPQPQASEWRRNDDDDGYAILQGLWGPVPQLQQGELPYNEAPSGRIEFDGGAPVVAQDLTLRFALTLPLGEMPADGYPLVLYAHGSGGAYDTFILNGVAEQLAREGFAVMGIDQNLHGPPPPEGRNPSDSPEAAAVQFFNYLNPYAARDNVRQAAIDVVQQARLAKRMTVPRDIMDVDPPVTFDPDNIFFYGHSQGGLNGPLFLAVDDTAKAAVLSGAGGTFAISIVDKTQPPGIQDLVKLQLRLPGSTAEVAFEQEQFVYEHPVLSVLQTWIEPADPVVYAGMFFRHPREGFAPKSILQTEGLEDQYTPPRGMESLAGAAEIPILEPAHMPIDALSARGIEPVSAPASGNVAGGEATAALLQFPDQGHFVASSDEGARASISEFFRTAADGEPRIVAP